MAGWAPPVFGVHTQTNFEQNRTGNTLIIIYALQLSLIECWPDLTQTNLLLLNNFVTFDDTKTIPTPKTPTHPKNLNKQKLNAIENKPQVRRPIMGPISTIPAL